MSSSCEVEFCDRPKRMKSWCMAHYHQQWSGKEFTPIRTPREYTPVFTSDRKRPKNNGPCSGPECERLAEKRGLCRSHYAQSQRGVELTPIRTRDAEATNRGPKTNPSGYVEEFNPTHPNSWKNGWILQHVRVMSEHLGRPLIKGENVHHKNGVRDDNRLENLELWSSAQPAGQRVEDKTAWAIEWLKQYAPEELRND